MLSDGAFRQGDGDWFTPGVGGSLYNTPFITHAMRSGRHAALCLLGALGAAGRVTGYLPNTTVRFPDSITRRSRCSFTARARTRHSMSRPMATRSSALIGVGDALDLLLDDRAFVEVGGHVVGGCADQLHAAVDSAW